MVIREKDLLKISMKALRLVGSHPHQNKYGTMFCWFILLLRLPFMYLGLLLAIQGTFSVDNIVSIMELCTTFLQGFSKICFLIFFKRNLRKMLKDVNQFWYSDNKFNKFDLVYKILINYKFLLVSTFTMLIVKTCITKTAAFPFYIPNFPHANIILIFMQYFELMFDAGHVYGVDTLFIISCIIITNQLKLIGVEMGRLMKEKNEQILEYNLKKCIKHHEFILSYANNVIECYNFALLTQYMMSMTTTFSELYIITEKRNIETTVTGSMYIMVTSSQLMLYCFMAQEVSTMSDEIATFAFHCGWYNLPLQLQKHIPLIICRAQRPVSFKAGNLVPLKRETVTDVFKTSVSFFMFLQRMREERTNDE